MQSNKLVVGYAAGVLTTIFAVALGQALAGAQATKFDTIDVRRINIREPDGTLRLVISDRARFPGMIAKGREYAHTNRADSAGLLFFNDEGTENGGLIFGGKSRNGKVVNFGHLSFDQYQQDQVVSLDQGEEDGKRWGSLAFYDRPDQSIDYPALSAYEAMHDGPQRAATLKKLKSSGAFDQARRVFIGKDGKRRSEISLADKAGKARLMLVVGEDGEPQIQFLDAQGRVVRTIGATGAK